MDLKSTQALWGYVQGRPATAAAAQPEASTSFQHTLFRSAAEFGSAIGAGDQAAVATMTGAGSNQELVTALAQSQLAVETAVAVRNKVVEAYQEILRMPV